MLGNVVRFDEDTPPVTSEVSQPAADQNSGASRPPVILSLQENNARPAESVPHDLTWMRRMIDQQMLLLEAAQRERALATAELERLAQTLCQEAWDAKRRAGESLDRYPPSAVADLIIQSVKSHLRNATMSQDPNLAAKHLLSATELANARTEIHSLRQRLRAAEDAVRETRAAIAKEARKRQEAAEKRTQATLSKSGIGSPERSADRWQRQPSVKTFVDDVGDVASIKIAESRLSLAQALTGNRNGRVDDVVKVIAELGLCRWKDVSAHLARLWQIRPTAGTMDTAISKAISLGLLRAEEVRLEWGGKPTGKMLLLTDRGQQHAVALGINPVESQYMRGLAAHKDGSHFYAILEVAGILAQYYADIDFFPQSVATDGGKYHPDVMAAGAEGQKLFVEVERATYKGEHDRDGKWLRAAAANNGAIYFVTPNQESMLAIADEINHIRQRNPDRIIRVLAFNVKSHRESKGQGLASLWSYDGSARSEVTLSGVDVERLHGTSAEKTT